MGSSLLRLVRKLGKRVRIRVLIKGDTVAARLKDANQVIKDINRAYATGNFSQNPV
ncbi:hypothetical protein BH09BAC4_BH09BAC4_45070 [soil metagenome]